MIQKLTIYEERVNPKLIMQMEILLGYLQEIYLSREEKIDNASRFLFFIAS